MTPFKTIALEKEVYDTLASLKRDNESFSNVVYRLLLVGASKLKNELK